MLNSLFKYLGQQLWIVVFIALSINSLSSQMDDNRFKSSVIVGFNLSQLDGDNLQGFDKPGLHLGLGTSYTLGQKSFVTLELLYQQKGSSSGIISGNSAPKQTITLNYLSLPLLYGLNEWFIEEGGFYKLELDFGLMTSRLFNVKSSNSFFNNAIDDFSDFDVGFIGGLKYNFNSKLGLAMRYERSFLKIYQNPNQDIRGLQSYLLNFRLVIAL